jgi:hypothetical protein
MIITVIANLKLFLWFKSVIVDPEKKEVALALSYYIGFSALPNALCAGALPPSLRFNMDNSFLHEGTKGRRPFAFYLLEEFIIHL